MKRQFLLFLVTLLSIAASAYDAFIDGIYYNFSGNEAIVAYCKPIYKNSVNIPASVAYKGKTYNVTSIGSDAFRGCSGLTSITIPSSVNNIGNYAFSGCSGLTSIAIPNSVTSIGNDAFQYCSRLTSVTIPSSVTSIGSNAFSGCYFPKGKFINNSVLTSINNWGATLCDSETSGGLLIKDRTVIKCRSWATFVTIPSSVTNIGNYAFQNCSGLTSVTIPESVTSIGNSAFSYCRGLTSVTIPNSVTSIGEDAFKYCRGLTSVTIPNSVTSIGRSAFENCSGLTSVTIPSSVTSIGDYAFEGCSRLTSVTIPESVTSIGYGAFDGCSGLTSVTIPSSVTSIGWSAFSGCSGLTSVTIPNSVTSIGRSAFENCSGLTSITIPSSVTSIGSSAFFGCNFLKDKLINNSSLTSGDNWGATLYDEETDDGLIIKDQTVIKCRKWVTSVTIPNSVTCIGSNAFDGCSDLTSVIIPSSVISIGNQAFKGCNSLKSISIGSQVEEVGYSAFDGTPWYENHREGMLYIGKVAYKYIGTMPKDTHITIKEGTKVLSNSLFSGCRDLTSVTIPNSVTSIGAGAFQFCTGLTSVTIPNSVTSIGNSAFDGCSGLTSITIPNSVTSIGDRAFEDCRGLTSITIPNSVTSIGNYAFSDCSSLTSVTIPESVTSIGRSAFENCSGLTSVTIGNGVTSIDNSAFYKCNGLTTITIPNSVTSIGNYAFQNCSGLTSVTIPNSVTSIGYDAFSGCSGLTSVTIPNSVTSIGYSAFNGCYFLKDRFINNSALTSSDNWGATLYDKETDDGLIIKDQSVIKCMDWATSVTIPSSVTSIGNSAFSGCRSLTSVTIPNSVTSIGDGAFSYCSGLTSVTIPNSVTSIGAGAFYNCSGLTSITIPSSVTGISNNGAFASCSSLTSIVVESGNTKYDSRNNCNAIIETASNTLIAGCKNTTIPNSVTNIGERAFEDCSSLTSITIPNSVTSIGNYAFKYCSGLKSVTIPNSVTSIGGAAFSGCESLTFIIIPNSVTSIGSYAFSGCSGLTSVTIGNGVTYIGNSAFSGCSGLTSVIIPNSVTTIGEYAFDGCTKAVIICNSEKVPSASYMSFTGVRFAIVPATAENDYKKANYWKDLAINTGFHVVNTTQTTITLVTSKYFSGQSVWLDGYYHAGGNYYPVGDTLKISGLVPDKEYTMTAFLNYGGNHFENPISFRTKPIDISIKSEGATNLTISVKGTYNIGDANVTESGFEEIGNVDEYTLTGLAPGKQYSFTYYVVCSDTVKIKKTATFSTVPVSVSARALSGATSVQLSGVYNVIDANVTDFGFTGNAGHAKVKLTGLDPETEYKKTFYVMTQEGGEVTTDVTFTTNSLTLATQQPKVISDGNVIVCATSNLDDEETNVGFEWRRTDWTDDFDSKSGGAYIYGGTMEGYIRSINSNYLWKFRPYYTSNAGNTYYGEWKGMDPSDYSYFEPTVHTYASINVTGNRAEVKGYAMRGTDRVTSQGFMYWKNNSSYSLRKKAASIPSDAVTVEVKGNVMTAALEDLDYDTEYCYVAFVATEENETFFGEVKMFSTSVDPDGIGDVMVSEGVTETVRYDLSGRKIDKPQRGINIVRYSDGTTRKVLVK